MEYNVGTLLQERIGARRTYTLVEEPFVFRGEPVAVSGTVELVRTDQAILARVAVTLTLREECVRCRRPCSCPLAILFEEEFWPPADPRTQQRTAISEERLGFPIIDSHLDLSEALRQYVEMARPMQPLCAPECPGDGGANPAPAGAREPEPTPGDDRWATLQTLQRRLT